MCLETELASFLDKNPTRIMVYRFVDFLKNLILGIELASFSDKKTDHILMTYKITMLDG